MAHFAHYVKRIVGKQAGRNAAPWFSERQRKSQGLGRPRYHITRQRTGAAGRIRVGDTIWIFSQLRTPWGNLPPALDAKIIVASISQCERDGKICTRFGASKRSRWFPLYDAGEILGQLEAISSSNQIGLLLNNSDLCLGQALQSMREINNPEVMKGMERFIDSAPFVFISYRHADGTKRAFDICRGLLRQNNAVFWDRWSLPRRLAERGEAFGDEVLERYLCDKISESRRTFGVKTRKYARKRSFSAIERSFAKRFGRKFKSV